MVAEVKNVNTWWIDDIKEATEERMRVIIISVGSMQRRARHVTQLMPSANTVPLV